MKAQKRGTHALGGAVGVFVAIAAGMGAAVGLYTLPSADSFAVTSEAYGRVYQGAVAASTLGIFNGRQRILHFEVSKGPRGYGGVGHDSAGDAGGVREDHAVEVRVYAEIRSCLDDGCDVEQQWFGVVSLDSFELSPLMDAASFAGEVEGCNFEIAWHPAGEIVPFEGHDEHTRSAINGENWDVEAGAGLTAFGEISRQAPADINMSPSQSGPSCQAYQRMGAPGFVTQGASASTFVHRVEVS